METWRENFPTDADFFFCSNKSPEGQDMFVFFLKRGMFMLVPHKQTT